MHTLHTRRGFAERYRAMRSRWNEEWWSIVFGGPIGNLLNACIADVRWITPNALTMLGFVLRLGTCALVVQRADLATIAALQLAVILDCMDGSLARYRGLASPLGAFLDKVTDAIALVAIFAAVGWRVFLDTGDAAALLVAVVFAAAMVVRFYVYWVVAWMERRAGAVHTTGVDLRADFSSFSWRERARRYVTSMPRIFGFSESDLYFWIAVGLALGRLRELVYVLGLVGAIWFVIVMALRFRTVLRLQHVMLEER